MYNVLTVLHTARSNRFYAAALRRDKQYVRAVEHRDQALKAQIALPAVDRPKSPLNTDVPLRDWLDGMAVAAAAEREHEAKAVALKVLIRDCDATIVSAAMVNPNRLLRCFAEQFADLMSDLRAVVRRLGGAKTAAEAVDVGNDAVDAWRELPPLRARYDEIRRAQAFVMQLDHDRVANSGTRYFDDELASDLSIRNLDNAFKGWRKPDRTIRISDDPPPDRRPWPVNDPEGPTCLAGQFQRRTVAAYLLTVRRAARAETRTAQPSAET